MFDLEQGTTGLLSFQQAIGGSLSRSARVTQDMDEDDEALECSSGSVVITVPALNEIVVPAQLIPPAATSQPTSLPLSPQPQPQTPVSLSQMAFRRVNAEKRKSDLSYNHSITLNKTFFPIFAHFKSKQIESQ